MVALRRSRPAEALLLASEATETCEGRLHPLRHVSLPASLYTKGVLVYIAVPAIPSELIIRSPGGQTIHSEKRAPLAREAVATCEGEAEG